MVVAASVAGCTVAEAGATRVDADLAPVPAPDVSRLPEAGATRVVHEQAWVPFAEVDGLVLVHPASRVERVAFHEAYEPGARDLVELPSASATTVLASRRRGTGGQTSVDVVVDPHEAVRAPVSGTVVASGPYRLYCRYDDHRVVIEPDGQPGLRVEVLHLVDVAVRPGDRVAAGTTVLSRGAHVLPFRSQVDALIAAPAWPHVHVEVVDTAGPTPARQLHC